MSGKKRPKPETRGRPEIPEDCRRVNLSCRIPARVLQGLKDRANSHGASSTGAPNSSVGLEVERAFDRSQ
jgi:hypothetical protein